MRMKFSMPLRGKLSRRANKREPGQAMIEMAIVMSILLILSFGMVDFGLFLTGYIRASNCAREMTRSAVVRNPDAASVCGDDQVTPLFESASFTLSPGSFMSASSGTSVTATVTATYRWKALAPLMNAFFPGTPWNPTITTTTRATMRMEGQRP
jgi:Flp pilus assembly protein TadG